MLFTSAGTVNEFEINGAPGKIYMQFFDGERVEIDYPTTTLLDYKICEKDGKIIITHGGFKFSNVSFKPKKIPAMFINIPRGIAPDCKIELAAGTLELGDGDYGKIAAYVKAGKLEAGRFSCTDAEFDTDAGKIAIGSVACRKIRFEINSGKLDAERVNADEAAFEVNAGKASVGQSDFKRTEIRVNTGKADITLCGAREDYDAEVSATLSSCNLKNRQEGHERTVKAEVSMGVLNVDFEN